MCVLLKFEPFTVLKEEVIIFDKIILCQNALFKSNVRLNWTHRIGHMFEGNDAIFNQFLVTYSSTLTTLVTIKWLLLHSIDAKQIRFES